MQWNTTLTLLVTAASLAPATVPAAFADGCNSKLIKTSYQRISPRTVKETKIYESTRLISKAAPIRHLSHRSTTIHRTAYAAPRTETTVTRRTSMLIPVSTYTAPVIVKPVVVAPTATTMLRASGLVPSTAVIRTTEITPTTVVRSAAIAPGCTVIKTQSVLTPAPELSSSEMVAVPGDTVVFKEKHGKLKQIGTLKPILWY